MKNSKLNSFVQAEFSKLLPISMAYGPTVVGAPGLSFNLSMVKYASQVFLGFAEQAAEIFTLVPFSSPAPVDRSEVEGGPSASVHILHPMKTSDAAVEIKRAGARRFKGQRPNGRESARLWANQSEEDVNRSRRLRWALILQK